MKNIRILLKTKIFAVILVILVISYSIMGLFNTTEAASTYSQSVKSGISAFPESYQTYLKQIKEQHPNWTFDAYYTGISWNDLVQNETDHGHNRVIKTADSLWRCSCGNIESGYACASNSIIKYYMDPRNFLDSDKEMFQFLESSYNNNYKIEVVQSILKNTFMRGNVTFNKDGKNVTMSYAQIIMDAARSSQMSPYAIAIKIIQEVGTSGSDSSSGTRAFIYTDGKQYTGYYNFFNFGSYDTGDAVRNGLIYAKDNGWDTPYKAIVDGAQKYGANYNSKGQNTVYFTKWDVVGTKILKSGQTQTVKTNELFRHQYMTNVQDPNSQSSRLYNTYSNNDILEQALNFVIPIYNDMPVANKLPTNLTQKDGNLYYTTGTDITVRATAGTSGTKIYSIATRDTIVAVIDRKCTVANGLEWDKVKLSNGKTGYIASKYLSPCESTLQNSIKVIDDKLQIKMEPKANMNEVKSKFGNNVTVKDKSGKQINEGMIGTGAKISVNNKEYSVIKLGDINGDGYIDTGDTFRIKQKIMKAINLEGVYASAADVNGDGYIDTGDSFILKKEVKNIPSIRL